MSQRKTAAKAERVWLTSALMAAVHAVLTGLCLVALESESLQWLGIGAPLFATLWLVYAIDAGIRLARTP